MTKAIEVEGLTKIYHPSTKAVDGVTFSVEEGEIFGLLGPNGAGKTTIMRILTTLASITEGRATVAGNDVSENPGAVRSSIGVVPQEMTLDNELKGIENLLLSAKLHKVPRRVSQERARDLLRLVELESAGDKLVRTYSGGDEEEAAAYNRPHPQATDSVPGRTYGRTRHPDEKQNLGLFATAQQRRVDDIHDHPLPRGG